MASLPTPAHSNRFDEETAMPYVRITAAGEPLTPRQVAALQGGTTTLLHRLLGKRAAVTVVTVLDAAAERWAVAGDALPPGARCAQVDAFITAGSNGGEQVAGFIAAVHGLLSEVLGDLAAPAYVMVHELAADQWGYDGRSQAQRRAAPAVVL